MKPSVGRIVHYVSFGTPRGEFVSTCRAAIVAEVDTESTLALAVVNPTGMFFNTCQQDEGEKRGGTWHWPEKV